MKYLQTEFQRNGIFLLPLRLFMGLAWMRVGLEKLFDPNWHSGETMRLFFQEQIQNGDVIFPFYQSLIHSTFEPAAGLLSGVIVFAELYIGFAILFGCFTNFALLGGIFMNLNFLLAGSASPSIFYILIQAVLLGTNSGAVFGFDKLLSNKIRSWFLVAQQDFSLKNLRIHPMILFSLAGATFGLGMVSTIYISDKWLNTPDDPALALAALCLIAGVLLSILAIRSHTLRKGEVFSHLSTDPETDLPVSPIPQMSVKDFATIGVRNVMADNTVRKVIRTISRHNAGHNLHEPAMHPTKRQPATMTVQDTYNEMATLLVPHNMVDSTIRNAPKTVSRHNAGHNLHKPAMHPTKRQPAKMTVQDTYNEMATLLVPHNMVGKSVREPGKNSNQNSLQKVYI